MKAKARPLIFQYISIKDPLLVRYRPVGSLSNKMTIREVTGTADVIPDMQLMTDDIA